MFIWDWKTRTKINCSWKVYELNLSCKSRNQVNFWGTPKTCGHDTSNELLSRRCGSWAIRDWGTLEIHRNLVGFPLRLKEEFQNRRAQRGWLVGHICTRILQICFCCQTFFQCYWTKCNRLFSMEQLLKATKVLTVFSRGPFLKKLIISFHFCDW